MITSVGSGVDKKLVNIGKVRKMGYEIGIEVYPLDKLILRADYTYNHAEDKSEDRKSDKVTGVAKEIANLSVQYTWPLTGTRMDMNGAYMGSMFNTVVPTEDKRSGYFLCNAKLSQKFLKDYEVYVAANNIFDEDYEWSSGYPGQGRNLWAGISMRY
jgi:outer membrane receptor protein involved in Fe transport